MATKTKEGSKLNLNLKANNSEIEIAKKGDKDTSFSKVVSDLMKATGLDKQTCESIVKVFYEQADKVINNIKNLITKKELKEVELLLHRLKGSAGNVRVKEISELAMNSEEAMRTLDFDKLDSSLLDIEKLLEELMISKKVGELAHDK
jgi:two-component system, sensor histidine kinase and response regulator